MYKHICSLSTAMHSHLTFWADRIYVMFPFPAHNRIMIIIYDSPETEPIKYSSKFMIISIDNSYSFL